MLITALKDTMLAAKVKLALIADENLGARSIHVDSENGTIILRGTVRTPAARKLAEAVAKRSGATKVQDELEITLRPFTPPQTIVPEDFHLTPERQCD